MTASRQTLTVSKLASWLATPLIPNQYLELINPLWSAQCCGKIQQIQRETDQAVTLEIQPNHLWQGASAGQYVRLGVEVDGVRQWRNYSVTTAQQAGAGTFRVTVGRVNGGRVSTQIQDKLRVGDVVYLDQAMGDFVLPTDVTRPLLFITAGTGITPVIGMLRELRASAAAANVVHLHFAPDAAGCLFLDELQAFNKLPGYRTRQSFTRADGQYFDAALLDAVCPDWAERLAYVCGPASLMQAVREHWQAHGDAALLKEESFQPVRAAVPEGAGGQVSFWKAGVAAEGAGDKSLLEVAEQAGLMPKHGCRMGICQECVTTLRDGQVRDLTTGEVFGEAGETIRICVCAAAGNVEIDL